MSHVLHYSKSLSRGLKKVFSQKYITTKFCGAIELVSLNCRFSKERKNNLAPGHEISESLFETGTLDADAESMIMDMVCSRRAVSQPLDFRG
jgi:hypothetical protein